MRLLKSFDNWSSLFGIYLVDSVIACGITLIKVSGSNKFVFQKIKLQKNEKEKTKVLNLPFSSTTSPP